ncbi:MAG: TonB-dependent receptor [Proteiniphilum sp.]|jgi:TonB-linked SusC/RagA family outer membrane protein|uniref:SusC/RagA family TonB-linked outer membrane protein n=1 Tax=Proteiniphilum sp. TaxID=1926877 RepID=UPI002B1FFD49|nr:TonB-dependent receptor [Proteiniphilum sp.]MEA5128838.1 TonB-dependent receptor [Proteiniphilum sp.]
MEKKQLIKIIMLFLLITLPSFLVAQSGNQINGRVVDEENEPLPGVSVSVKGTSTGTITDLDGLYAITVKSEDVLVFSFIGFTTQEIIVGQQKSINVTMEEESKVLDDVVVVGYGTQKKVNLTGSVVAVKGQELSKRPVMNAMAALQGMAPGVSVTVTSGQPGKEGESIKIRGIGTLNNSNPLVLVDGIASSINAVNAQDIESISILKDAASSAIYGSRAANGVILITTKRAAEGKFSINISANVGFQRMTEQPDFLGAIDFLELYDLALSNDTRNMETGAKGGVLYGRDYIENYKSKMALDPYNYPDTDWAKITYQQPAIQQQYNITLSGGTERLKTLASINYANQEGVFPDTDMKRYSIRLNTDYKFNDKLSAGIDLAGRLSDISEPTQAASGIISSVRRTAPIYGWITPTGKPVRPTIGENTWAMSQKALSGYNDQEYQEGIANLKVNYSPIKELNLEFSYSPKLNFSANKVFVNKVQFYDVNENPIDVTQNRVVREQRNYELSQDLKFLINATKTLNKHNINILGGYQQNSYHTDYLYGRREKSPFTYDQLDAFPVENQSTAGSASEMALRSLFGRLNYDYASKYLFEANVRYDGSSRFADGYRWGFFPSFSAGWRITEEPFLKDNAWLSNAKLRASWGELGNQEVGSYYPFSQNISLTEQQVFNGNVVEGYAAAAYAFRDISWETTTMTNIGLDLGFFDNKLNAVFDWYVKNTKDILMNLDIPLFMGYENSPLRNAGEVENKGWELSLSYNNKAGDVSYRITGILSDVKNKILDMKGIVSDFDEIYTNRVGSSINSIYGLEVEGLFSSFEEAKNYPVTQFGDLQGGDIKYKDQLTVDTNGDGIPDAGDGIITSADYVILGNTIPHYEFSLDLFAEYKGFDATLFFQGVGKRDGYLRGDLAWAFNNGAKVQQWQKDGMWQEGQTNAAYPRMFVSSSNNIKPSTFWMQDASYLRLKTVQLGYTIPKKVLDKIYLSGARVYFSAQNLFTLHNMTKGYDPEQSPTNAQTAVPLLRTYTFGININF